MLWRVWAVVAAVVSGVLVSTFPGGSISRGAKLILLAALLFGVAATAVAALSRSRKGRRSRRRSRHHAHLDDLLADPYSFEHDREAVRRLFAMVQVRDIEWLRTERFASPWRDDRVAPLLRLAQSDDLPSTVLEPELAAVIGGLADATAGFLHLYDGGTVADPLTRDGTWRMIRQGSSPQDTAGSTEPGRIDIESRLRDAAAVVCEWYDALVVVARVKFPPD